MCIKDQCQSQVYSYRIPENQNHHELELRERIKQLEDGEEKHAEITTTLHWENGNLNRKLRRANRDIEDLEEKNKEHAVEMKKVNIIIERRDTKIKELERNLKRKSDEVQKLTLEKENLNRNIEDMEGRNKELAIEMTKANTTISRRDTRINDLKLELERNERLHTDTISKLQRDLTIKTEEAEELQDQLIANEDESDRVQGRLESELEAKEKEMKEVQQQIINLKQRRENSDRYRVQFERLKGELAQKTEEMKNYQNQRAIYETKVAELIGKLTASRVAVEAMTGTIKHKEVITVQLHQQIIELRQKLHAAEKVARDRNTIIERKKRIIEQMKRHQSTDKVQHQLARNQKSGELKNISEQMRRYRDAAIDLKTLAEFFPCARIDDVDWAKNESEQHSIMRTKQLQKYKDHISSHSKYARLPDGKCLMENNPVHERKCDYKEHELEAFKLFVEWNGIGNRTPTTMNESDLIALGYVTESSSELKDIVKVRIVTKCLELPFLVGQQGTFAKVDIAEGVILGQYLGNEMLQEESQDVYNGTKEEKDHLTFANGAELMVNGKILSIVIDAFPAFSDSPLLYINDGRTNFKETATPIDEERINTEFVSVLCNGWPMVLVRSTKPIKAGQQLYIDYGATYNNVLDQIQTICDQQKKMKRETKRILNKYGLTEDIYNASGFRADASDQNKCNRNVISSEDSSSSRPKRKKQRESKKRKRYSNAPIPRPQKKSRRRASFPLR